MISKHLGISASALFLSFEAQEVVNSLDGVPFSRVLLDGSLFNPTSRVYKTDKPLSFLMIGAIVLEVLIPVLGQRTSGGYPYHV